MPVKAVNYHYWILIFCFVRGVVVGLLLSRWRPTRLPVWPLLRAGFGALLKLLFEAGKMVSVGCCSCQQWVSRPRINPQRIADLWQEMVLCRRRHKLPVCLLYVTGTNDYHIGFVPLDLERDDLHLQLKLCFCCRMTVWFYEPYQLLWMVFIYNYNCSTVVRFSCCFNKGICDWPLAMRNFGMRSTFQSLPLPMDSGWLSGRLKRLYSCW